MKVINDYAQTHIQINSCTFQSMQIYSASISTNIQFMHVSKYTVYACFQMSIHTLYCIVYRYSYIYSLWVPLFGMIFPLNFVFCRRTFPVLFINSRLFSLAEPGLGAPLSGYLEGAL